jgi:Bacteriophage Lambda NinG protein
MPRCRNCKDKFEPVRFNAKYCLKDECIKAFVEEVKAKEWKKTKAKLKNEIKTNSDWLKEAQKVFNTYIRLRDQGKPCISCGKEPKKKNCGHYFSQGGHSNVRFDEENCHLQCEHCNTFLSGNLLNYQIGIQQRIGADRLIELQARAHLTKRWSVEELKELIKKYKEKCKELK